MDKKKIFKLNNILFICIVAIVGILLLWLPQSKILNDIGSVFLISGLYTIFDSYILKSSLIDLVIEKVNLDKNIDETGLIEINKNLANINYNELFEKANSNIDILHIYGRTWTTNNYELIKDVVMTKECKLRIVLLNPASLFVPALEDHFSYSSGVLSENISNMVIQWSKLKAELAEKEKYFSDKSFRKANKNLKNKKYFDTKHYGKIEIYYYNGQPTNSMYRVDDKIIVINTKTSKDKSIRLPYSVYKKAGECCLFNVYMDEFEKIVLEATQVD